MAFRVESDLLGTIRVPANALYEAQTNRALDNFLLGNQPTIGTFPTMIKVLLFVKKAAAIMFIIRGK